MNSDFSNAAANDADKNDVHRDVRAEVTVGSVWMSNHRDMPSKSKTIVVLHDDHLEYIKTIDPNYNENNGIVDAQNVVDWSDYVTTLSLESNEPQVPKHQHIRWFKKYYSKLT